MRLQYLGLENFKCFRKLDIDFGKITLLTGANSSGKSSVIYSILGAIQSGEFPFQFSPNGKFVEMGDFREMVFGHDETLEIGINMKIETTEDMAIESLWKIDEERRLPRLLKSKVVGATETIVIERSGDYYVCSSEYPNTMEKTIAETELIALEFQNEYRSLPILLPSKNEVKTTMSLVFLKNRLMLFESDLNYIGSFRHQPERTYYEQTKTQLKVGKHGEQYTDQIILWQTQKAKELAELQRIGQSLGLFHRIFAKRSDGGRYELRVRPNVEELDASLTDVGFGISQFLPIVVADLQLGDDSVLFVSQPETHLHPSIQSTFADYLVDRILHTNKTYVIETHSEYLINRLRLAVAKKQLQEDDLKAYYFKKTGIEATSYPLRFLPNGQIVGAPEDFFKTYMMDVMEIAMTAE